MMHRTNHMHEMPFICKSAHSFQFGPFFGFKSCAVRARLRGHLFSLIFKSRCLLLLCRCLLTLRHLYVSFTHFCFIQIFGSFESRSANSNRDDLHCIMYVGAFCRCLPRRAMNNKRDMQSSDLLFAQAILINSVTVIFMFASPKKSFTRVAVVAGSCHIYLCFHHSLRLSDTLLAMPVRAFAGTSPRCKSGCSNRATTFFSSNPLDTTETDFVNLFQVEDLSLFTLNRRKFAQPTERIRYRSSVHAFESMRASFFLDITKLS